MMSVFNAFSFVSMLFSALFIAVFDYVMLVLCTCNVYYVLCTV